MKPLKGIKCGLVCTASAITIACMIGYFITGGWHLLVIAICACVLGLSIKTETVE